jgi:hypothetical protein
LALFKLKNARDADFRALFRMKKLWKIDFRASGG